MKSFAMGITYLRDEALKSGFILESDNDDKLVERLSQLVRKLGPEDAERCDALTREGQTTEDKPEPATVPQKEEEKKVESSSDKGAKGKT